MHLRTEAEAQKEALAQRKRTLALLGSFAEAMPRLRTAALLEDEHFELGRLFWRESIADAMRLEWGALASELGLSWGSVEALEDAVKVEVRAAAAMCLLA